MVPAVGTQPERGQLVRPAVGRLVEQQPPQQPVAGVPPGAEQFQLRRVVAVDQGTLQGAGVPAELQQGLQQRGVGYPGGPAAVERDLHHLLPARLHPAQQAGDGDALRGPVGAEPPSRREVPLAGLRQALEGGQPGGQQGRHVPTVLRRRQPRHLR